MLYHIFSMKNYHTHTARCQHATGEDEEYVRVAISEGFSTLGFSDHTPFPYEAEGFVSQVRMVESELPDYVASIRSLEKKYSGLIELKLGLECEPFFRFFPYLKEKKEEFNLDYLILGNHYFGEERDHKYYGYYGDKSMFKEYASAFAKGAESGLFSYIAHPDLIFSSYPVFDEEAKALSKELFQIAEEYNMPLEYNVSGFYKRPFRGLGYPCDNFWEIGRDYKVKALVGLDAHKSEQIAAKVFKEGEEKLSLWGYEVVGESLL